jgi:hypothetical protein
MVVGFIIFSPSVSSEKRFGHSLDSKVFLFRQTPIAMAVPRAKTESQVAGDQRLKVIDVFSTEREVIR